jgi:SAM-dependent methyltransferase
MRSPHEDQAVLQRELDYHEQLYSGFAQQHFAKPAVRALREHMVRRVLEISGAGRSSRVLSLGCGIGDTELLLAPRVAELVGLDLSPAAIDQARRDAARASLSNVRFEVGSVETAGFPAASFDLVIGIFLLHHLPQAVLEGLPSRLWELLRPGGLFYSMDPSRQRLSGKVGKLLIPRLMQKYQTPDEQELDAQATQQPFHSAGFEAVVNFYDFGSSPLAGLLPGWRAGYRLARWVDDLLIRTPGVRQFGSNFEVIARRPR